jgi:TonB family protein
MRAFLACCALVCFVVCSFVGPPLLAQSSGANARLAIVFAGPAAAGDRIEVLASSDQTTLALVTPDGRRITAANAASEGFGWYLRRFDRTSWGTSLIVPFERPAPAGEYSIEVSGPPARASVSLERISSQSYTSPRFPGAVVFALPMRPPGIITLPVEEQHPFGVIDILVSDPGTTVLLTLPDGSVVAPQPADPSTAPRQVAGLLFPHPGRHHLIYLHPAQSGKYQIHANDPHARGEFFLSYEPASETPPETHAEPPAASPIEIQPPCRVSLVSARVAGRPDREGRVVVSARIDEQGRARDAKVIRSTAPALDRDAIEYVERCLQHKPGQGQLQLELTFRVI